MKKLLLLLLFIPLVSFGQDFRKMDWGQTVENLKELYPEINFIMSKENEQEVYSHFELVLDIESKVSYFFDKNQLLSGRYIFFSTVGAAKRAIKNFNLISERLNEKYKMNREIVWNIDEDLQKRLTGDLTWMLTLNYKTLSEMYISSEINIEHSLEILPPQGSDKYASHYLKSWSAAIGEEFNNGIILLKLPSGSLANKRYKHILFYSSNNLMKLKINESRKKNLF